MTRAAMAAKDSLEIDGDPFKLIDDKGSASGTPFMLSANVPPPRTPRIARRRRRGRAQGFREIGVGYAIAENGTPYWCAIFAKPAPPKRIIRR